tara:strand:+ start:2209 stop:3318 length:1110 start_codon:yes stop_codon:yes gene_type:complete
MSPIYVGVGTADSEARSTTIGLPLLTADPSSPQVGDMYYSTTENWVRSYDGSAWVDSITDSLYTFSTYTFNEPDWGREGPSWSTLQTRYSGEPFLTTGNLVQGQHTGFHKLTLPRAATYEFEAAGAPGSRTGGYNAGRGIILKGRMYFNEGDIIQFSIGKSGESDSSGYNGGGGGGTFIVKNEFFTSSQSDSNIILIAGGGSGGAYNTGTANQDPQDAHASKNGRNGQGTYRGNGGTNGNGGNGRGYGGNYGPAGPAAGIYSAATNFSSLGQYSPATAWKDGAQGARGYYAASGGGGHQSGFGCAGGGGNHAGGSGGGYSGGGGGGGNGESSGGGGSFTDNLSSVSTVGYQGTGTVVKPAGGYVKITVV